MSVPSVRAVCLRTTVPWDSCWVLTLATRPSKVVPWRLAGVDEICRPVNNPPHGGIMLAWNVPASWLYATPNRARDFGSLLFKHVTHIHTHTHTHTLGGSIALHWAAVRTSWQSRAYHNCLLQCVVDKKLKTAFSLLKLVSAFVFFLFWRTTLVYRYVL